MGSNLAKIRRDGVYGTQSNWPVLTRPPVAGFGVPRDIDSIPKTEAAMLKAQEDEKRICADAMNIIREQERRMALAKYETVRTVSQDLQARGAEDLLRRLREAHPRLFGLPAPRHVEDHHQKNYLHGERVIQD